MWSVIYLYIYSTFLINVSTSVSCCACSGGGWLLWWVDLFHWFLGRSSSVELWDWWRGIIHRHSHEILIVAYEKNIGFWRLRCGSNLELTSLMIQRLWPQLIIKFFSEVPSGFNTHNWDFEAGQVPTNFGPLDRIDMVSGGSICLAKLVIVSCILLLAEFTEIILLFFRIFLVHQCDGRNRCWRRGVT